MDIIQKLFVLYWGNAFFIVLALLFMGVYFISRKPSITLHFEIKDFANGGVLQLFVYGVLTLTALHMTLYLSVPNFADYGEPVMILLAGNLAVGAPVYADWTTGSSIIGSNYGPNSFLVQLPVILIFKSIFASKMTGVLASISSFIIFYSVIRREAGHAYALWFCVGLASMLTYNLHYWFWNRPDSFLLLLTSLACLSHQRLRTIWLIPCLAILASISINFKIFSPIYLIPFAVSTFLKIPLNWEYILIIAISVFLFLFLFLVPFSVFDIHVYFRNVLLMRNQGLDTNLAVSSLAYIAIISFLPIYLVTRCTTSLETKTLSALLVSCGFITAIISGKPGGGPPYIMPFALLAFYISAKAIREFDVHGRRRIGPQPALYIVLVLICAAPIWAYSWYQMARQLPVIDQELAKAADLTRLFSEYPNAEMGHGLNRAGKSYSTDEYYRVHKSLLDQPVRFDYVNYVDQRLAGLQPSILYPLLKNCSVPVWIFSKSTDKFGGTGYYGLETFDNIIRELFIQNYKLDKSTSYFEAWTCKTEHSD